MAAVSVNLKQHPPRSPRVRLGGFVILQRLLDKYRATIAGTNGEYLYPNPIDQHFLTYVGIDAEALKAEVKKGLGDWEILEWIRAHAQNPRDEAEICCWSDFQTRRAPDSIKRYEYVIKKYGDVIGNRSDIVTFFDILDLDDYVSFGGKV